MFMLWVDYGYAVCPGGSADGLKLWGQSFALFGPQRICQSLMDGWDCGEQVP